MADTTPTSWSPSERVAHEAQIVAAAWVAREYPGYDRKGIHTIGLRGQWPDTVIFAEWAGPSGDGEWSTGIYKDRPFEHGQPRDVDAEAFAIDFLDAVREN